MPANPGPDIGRRPSPPGSDRRWLWARSADPFICAVEAEEMAAAERHPHTLGCRCRRRVAQSRAADRRGFRRAQLQASSGRDRAARPHFPSEHADRTPHRTVDWARHDRVEAAGGALVFLRIDRLVGLDIGSRLPLPSASRTSAVQPCAFTASPVSSNTLPIEPGGGSPNISDIFSSADQGGPGEPLCLRSTFRAFADQRPGLPRRGPSLYIHIVRNC